MTAGPLINVECVSVTILAVALLLAGLTRRLARRRPGLDIGRQVTVGYVLRILTIIAISLTGFGSSLRGGDELGFLADAHRIAPLPLTSGLWLPWDHKSFLHVLLFSLQIKGLGSPPMALRVTQVGIALWGVLLIVAAVHDLADSASARLAAWLMVLEPGSLFFNELLHKDPLMELSSGLAVLGATKIWQGRRVGGTAMMVAGVLVAFFTRNYIGYFLSAGTAMVLLHAWVRSLSGAYRALPALMGIAVFLAVAGPVVLAETSSQNLKGLANSQTTNATSTKGNGSASGNNLALEQVDFSSRTGIITNLPLRVRDLLLRPYPWQLADLNQSIGAIGSIVALTCLFYFVRFAWLGRGMLMDRAGPLLYPLIFLTIAYSLAVGNAGTGFRYRTHLVTLALPTVVLLRRAVRQRQARAADAGPLTRTDRMGRLGAVPEPIAL